MRSFEVPGVAPGNHKNDAREKYKEIEFFHFEGLAVKGARALRCSGIRVLNYLSRVAIP
jgi:hypothetical protein